MGWTITTDAGRFSRHAASLLERRPAENTVALTALAQILAGRTFSEQAATFGWYDAHGRVAGAVLLTPPFELLLAEVPVESSEALVSALRSAGTDVPGVNGRAGEAERFAAAWLPPGAKLPPPAMNQRLYHLEELAGPDPMPPGTARLATLQEVGLLSGWLDAFNDETGSRGLASEGMVHDRIESGLLFIWEVSGRVVSVAGRSPTVAGVARVGPVYTPADHRRQGYGAAVTAACTADALAHGAERVVLFTDLANQTSNAIYQQIGYRPVSDRVIYRF